MQVASVVFPRPYILCFCHIVFFSFHKFQPVSQWGGSAEGEKKGYRILEGIWTDRRSVPHGGTPSLPIRSHHLQVWMCPGTWAAFHAKTVICSVLWMKTCSEHWTIRGFQHCHYSLYPWRTVLKELLLPGIISNNIKTCPSVHSKKLPLILSSSLQLLYISLLTFTAKFLHLFTSSSLHRTLQSGFSSAVHPNCSY